MFYKEWLIARLKFAIMALVFAAASAFIISLNFIGDSRGNSSIFNAWLGLSLVLVVTAAIMSSVEAIASEKDANTLSFLITRPVSRTKIYLSKLGVNALWITTVFGASSIFMLMVDQMPRLATKYEGTVGPCNWVSWEFLGFVQANSTGIGLGFFQIATILMLGYAVLAIGTLVSIFSRNVAFSLMFTVLSIFVAYNGGIIAGRLLFGLNNEAYFSLEHLPLTFGSVAGFTAVMLGSGLAAFRRKEFS